MRVPELEKEKIDNDSDDAEEEPKLEDLREMKERLKRDSEMNPDERERLKEILESAEETPSEEKRE